MFTEKTQYQNRQAFENSIRGGLGMDDVLSDFLCPVKKGMVQGVAFQASTSA